MNIHIDDNNFQFCHFLSFICKAEGSAPQDGSFDTEFFGKGKNTCTWDFSASGHNFKVCGGVQGTAYEITESHIAGRTFHVAMNIYDP